MKYINKQNILVVIFAAIIMIIVFAIIALSFGQKKPLQESPSTPTNTPSFPIPSTTPAVQYDTEKSKELLNKLKYRSSISQNDVLAKEKILAQLPAGQRSGTLYKTENIIIDYVNSANIFQVEILTTNINSAKSEANAWFSSQGMSQQGICSYPVQFYLNYDVSQSLRDSNVKFNPLAEGC